VQCFGRFVMGFSLTDANVDVPVLQSEVYPLLRRISTGERLLARTSSHKQFLVPNSLTVPSCVPQRQARGRFVPPKLGLLRMQAEVGAFDLDLLAHLMQARTHALADAVT
jgi:hypothetical protein